MNISKHSSRSSPSKKNWMNQERPGTILKPRAMDVNANSLGCKRAISNQDT